MPYAKRRTTYRRRTSKYSRRPFNRRRRFSRRGPKRLTDGTQYAFKRTVKFDTITSNTLDSFGAYSFSLSNVTNSAEFTSLYDSYKISGVKLTFMPRITDATGSTGSNGFGTFVYVPDYDDAIVPTSELQLLERQSAKMKQPMGRPWKIYLKPKPSMELFTTPLTSYAQAPKSTWINTSSATTPHYGLKWYWDNISVVMTIDVYCTYYLKFKAVK